MISGDGGTGAPGGTGTTCPTPHGLPALLGLIDLLSRGQDGAASAHDDAIDRAAAAALLEAGAPAGGGGAAPLPHPAAALDRTLRSFGYDAGRGFAQPLDARRLAIRLRSMLFTTLRPCGGGTYSLCFRSTFAPTGRPVVLKRLKIEQGDEGVPSTALREVSLMRALERSPHIVQ